MKNRPLCSICLFICLIIGVGTVCGGEKLIKELRPSAAELHMQDGEDVFLTGTLYQKTDKEKYQILYLKDNSIKYRQQSLKESRLIIYDEEKQNADIGDILIVSGEISFFESARNPGNFDSKLYYQKQDIHANVWSKSIQIQKESPHTFYENMKNTLYQFRKKWKSSICEMMGKKDGNILSAMLLGEKAQMDEELRELYQANGIGHILAISGIHLSFVGIGMYKILRRLTGSYPIGGAFGILFLMLYILMIGFTVSAVRALTMFLFRVGADMAGRHYDAPTALSAAAVVVLLWRPLSLYDGGFWLSFGAVFAILAAVPVMQKSVEGTGTGKDVGIRTHEPVMQKYIKQKCMEKNSSRMESLFFGMIHRFYAAIMQGMVACIGINMVLFPIILYFFFEFPVYSFLLNLFVIPLMSILLFMGMAGSFLSFTLLPLSGICFGICRKILWLYKISCNLALTLPGARFVVGKPKMWKITVYYGIMAIVLLLLREKERRMEQTDAIHSTAVKRHKISGRKTNSRRYADNGLGGDLRRKAIRLGRFAFFIGTAAVIILVSHPGERGKLTAVVLDVGQGDGIFMRGPKGGTYLVDGGSSDVKKAGQYRLEPFLKSQGVGVLDYVLVSHGDSDHMNGVEELIERQDIGVRIGTLVLPVQEVWDEALAGLAEKAREHGIRVTVIDAGQSITEERMTVACIQPGNTETEVENGEAKVWAEGGYEPGNAASMVLAVKFGEFDMLLAGDVEGEGEERLTGKLEEECWDYTWEVLKVAHHGSKNSSSEEFLRQLQPAYAFISAGQENRYGHPHQETLERLMDVGSRIYSTQENGAIIVEVEDGQTMRVGKY